MKNQTKKKTKGTKNTTNKNTSIITMFEMLEKLKHKDFILDNSESNYENALDTLMEYYSVM